MTITHWFLYKDHFEETSHSIVNYFDIYN